MKHLFTRAAYLLLATSSLFIISCEGDPEVVDPGELEIPDPEITEQTIKIDVSASTDGFTRAVYYAEGLSMEWSEGDVIRLLDSNDESYDFNYNPDKENLFELYGLDTKPTDVTCELLYPASAATLSPLSSNLMNLSSQQQKGNGDMSHLAESTYLYAETSNLDEVIPMSHQTAQIKFLFTLDEGVAASSVDKLIFTASQSQFVEEQRIDGGDKVMSDTIEIDVELTDEDIKDEDNRLLTIYAMILPMTLEDCTLTVQLKNKSGGVIIEKTEEVTYREYPAGYQHYALLVDQPDLYTTEVSSSSDITWQSFGPGMSGNNKVAHWHPTDPNYLYISPNMGNSYVSTDAGKSYTTLLNWDAEAYSGDGDRGVGEIQSLDFSREDDTFGFATDDDSDGIYLTNDKGLSWSRWASETFSDHYVSCIAVNPKNHNTWYAGAGRMRDYANTLFPAHRLNGYYSDSTQYKTTAIANSKNKVWCSTDKGNTWTQCNTSGLHSETDVESIIVDPDESSTIYLSSNYGFYKSTNSGMTWSYKQIRKDFPFTITAPDGSTYTYTSNEVIRSLKYHSKSKKLFALTDITWTYKDGEITTHGGGVFVSSDKGETWKALDMSGLNVNINTLAYTCKTSYATAAAHYFKEFWTGGDEDNLNTSASSGGTLSLTKPTQLMSRFVMMEVDPNDENRIILVNEYSNSSRNNIRPGMLWKTEDGGETWEVAARNGLAWWDKEGAYASACATDYAYWVDRGQTMGNNMTFTYLSEWMNDAAHYDEGGTDIYDAKGANFARYNCDGTVLHSQMAKISIFSYNHGETWEDIGNVYVSEADNTYVGAGNSNVPGHGFYQSPLAPNKIYCSSGENSLWIYDSAENSSSSADQVAKNVRFTTSEMSLSSYTIDPTNANYHYATFFRQTNMGDLMRSTDGGTTWEDYGEATGVWDQNAYSGDQSVHQLCLTIDPNRPNYMYFCVPMRALQLAFVGDSKCYFGVWRSKDYGKTFSRDYATPLPVSQNKGVANTEGYGTVPRIALAPDGSGTLYAALEGSYGGLFKLEAYGDHWEEVESTKFMTIYTGSKSNYVTGDNGEKVSWSGMNDIHFAEDGAAYVTVGSNNSQADDEHTGLWVSYDDMKSWYKIFSYPYPSRIESAKWDAKVLLLTALPATNISSINPGTYLSRDGGSTWVKINTGNGQSDRVNDIAIDYNVKGRYYASTYGSGFYVAYDNRY
ncbi:MAG: hypothetical protein SNG14_03845 [Rikenellaceae bacterium]